MGKAGNTGLKRIRFAVSYSLSGIAWAWRNEAAFRQEVVLAVLLAPLGLYLGQDGAARALLVGSLLLALIVELLNTAIEAVVDRFGGEHHPLSKAAKDLGSAAVFVSLVSVVVVWVLVLI
jgi:diacylglycerol kinase (ATP)